jgi:pyruvate carboxylase
VFFYGLKPGEETIIEIARGKSIIVQPAVRGPGKRGRPAHGVLQPQRPDPQPGSARPDRGRDARSNTKVDRNNPAHVAAPLQGLLSKVLVKTGEKVARNSPLFVIEAMKMETTITAPQDLTVAHYSEAGTRVAGRRPGAHAGLEKKNSPP